jgi:hypothetical protein
MVEHNYTNWEFLADVSRFDNVTDDTTGSNILSSDVPEDRVYYPFVMVLSDTAGAANTVQLDKVEEDDTATTIYSNFNLSANETRFITAETLGLVLPRLEGDTNLKLTAGVDGVEGTVFYFPNEV